MADEIPTEALEAGEFAALSTKRAQIPGTTTHGRSAWLTEDELAIVRAAVRAAAPKLIAEGRRQAAQAIRDTGANAGWSLVHREAAAAIVEGTDHG